MFEVIDDTYGGCYRSLPAHDRRPNLVTDLGDDSSELCGGVTTTERVRF